MSELNLTPQQQRFFIAVLNGMPEVEAYKAAGFRGAKGEKTQEALRKAASAVANSPRVRGALAHARARAAERAEETVATLVARLDRAYEIGLTCDPPQVNAAVAAAMGMGKLLGLVVDRSELNVTRDKPALHGVKDVELTEDEWRRTFALPPR